MTTTSRTELENEAIRICQELIRIPSVNYGDMQLIGQLILSAEKYVME